MKFNKLTFTIPLAISGVVFTGFLSSAKAADFSFRGNFTQDNDTAVFDFTAGGTSTVTLRSYSYAGGTNAAGDRIPAGGFDPILSIFDGSGNLIDTVDDGPLTVPSDPITSRSWDTHFQEVLDAGDYRVVVSQYDNFANGPTFSDGFRQDDEPDFTSSRCTAGIFCDVSGVSSGNSRTSAWAFDILGVEEAQGPGPVEPPTPEPPTPEPPEPPTPEPPTPEPPEPPTPEPPIPAPPAPAPPEPPTPPGPPGEQVPEPTSILGSLALGVGFILRKAKGNK